ncbi:MULTISPECIES: hypothetical protein [Methylobacterium]|jgi:hypothetical protein|uniref:YCII-related domain-containing protein n=1 Tax=Methylobacterium longum TaxID=767694 RepID=A0ABT8AXA5_9HYPH|nr:MULTISPECIES: hypothetical protein [Methylobacterium]MCJ2102530.1 hypothetical protein [Methylobacterium sp. E-046]MDN3574613.1 hypothetical protein [Methylobacterium longum]GJE10393.1 hypothetical protein FOHLNKBM_1426 [Methylobacterium longum]
MTRFLVLYCVPSAVIEGWKRTAPETRGPAEAKMKAAWDDWMQAHAGTVNGTEAGGRTKRVASDGISDIKNDVMLYAFAEAESHDAAAQMFADHPHLQIPQASIQVMEVRAMTGP